MVKLVTAHTLPEGEERSPAVRLLLNQVEKLCPGATEGQAVKEDCCDHLFPAACSPQGKLRMPRTQWENKGWNPGGSSFQALFPSVPCPGWQASCQQPSAPAIPAVCHAIFYLLSYGGCSMPLRSETGREISRGRTSQ